MFQTHISFISETSDKFGADGTLVENLLPQPRTSRTTLITVERRLGSKDLNDDANRG
jgi:hypothetical protein